MTRLWKTTSVSVLLLAVACVIANPALLSTDECLDEISWPDPTNCSRYYVCAPWGPQIMECGEGTHYNPEKQICDWPNVVNCVVSTTSTVAPETSPNTTPTQPPTTEAPSTEAPSTEVPSTEVPSTESPELPTVEAETPEEPTGTPEPEPETTEPSEPETTEAEPEPTTEAEPEPTTDVEPESTTEAEPEPTTEVEPEPTTEVEPEPTTEAEPEPTTDAEPEPTTEAEPEPTTEGAPEPTTAAPVETTTIAITTTTEGKTPQDICAEFPNLFFVTSYPNDCTRFIACNYGEPNIFACPEGNFFSPILSSCIADSSHCTV